jgi:hypothetical protein
MTAAADVVPAPHDLALARAWAAREASVLAALLVVAALVLATLPYQLAQDGWLSLVAGREVAAAGLPHTDELTALGGGRPWIDQQWLAHLALYGATRLGGIGLLLALHALVLVGTFALAALAGRRLGGAPAVVALLVVGAAAAAPWAWQVRAQTLALPLAVALLWLLAEDRRRPSPRVLLVLPLLALWANVHGSVLLGAGLVAVAGVLAALHRRPESLALLAAPATALASPYGLDLVDYYRRMLGDRTTTQYVVEWQPSAPGAFTAVFYVVAVVALVAVARRGTAFDRIAVGLLVLAGASAIRNVVWVALAALVLVPRLLARGDAPAGRPMRAFALVTAAVAVAAAGWATTSSDRVERLWPREAAAAAGAAQGLVFSDERFADWLLWEEPGLRGRVVLDARFELYRGSELEAVHDLYGGRGTRALRGARVVVLATEDRGLVRRVRSLGFRRANGDGPLAVLVR